MKWATMVLGESPHKAARIRQKAQWIWRTEWTRFSRASAASGSASSLRFPEFDGVSFRIVQAGEAAVRIPLGIELHFNFHRAKLGEHRVEIAHAKVNHPLLLRIAEIVGVVLERSKSGRAGLL